MKPILETIQTIAVVFFTTAITISNSYAVNTSNQSTEVSITEEVEYAQYIFEVENGSIQKIFFEKSNVRSHPNLYSDIIDQVDTGQEVQILESASVLKIGNRSANWYKISYEKNNITQTGYIWGAKLSVGYRHLNGYDFLFGINPLSGKQTNNVDMNVKVLKDNELKQNINFEAGSDSLTSVSFRWGDDVGLKGVDKLLIAQTSGESCGVPSVSKYMLWSDEKLVELPTLMSVSDAGVFYHSEEYFFPSDEKGKAGHIIMNLQESEYQDIDLAAVKEINKKTVYQWQTDSTEKNGQLVSIN